MQDYTESEVKKMAKLMETKLGNVEISEDVIATISGAAAIECYGLVGMASRKISDGVSGLLKRENLSKGVNVTVQEEDLIIDLNIIVGYGIKISEVASNVMDRVRYTVETMTGLKVAEVNVNVQGVRFLE
ncbi:Asp23/Gls24 family envelope stress response protein [Dehalobacter sp. MCB1]|uniref:Asp23/Gls24 family envelope stress response protein n=2 Tax=Dehalobacter TaxID=56112 RepID=UPI001FAA3329|nr:Asp23/Gls24 family envelope stress response protein [Dehalobacter sp. MCB1]